MAGMRAANLRAEAAWGEHLIGGLALAFLLPNPSFLEKS